MNKLAIIAAVALSAGAFGLAAIAQDATVTDFVKADGNNDKVVTFDEAFGVYPTLSQALYDQADVNKDGTLDETEYLGLQALTAGEPTDQSSSESSSELSSSSSSSTPG